MLKKFFTGLMAAGMLLATSCQQQEFTPALGEATVTFEVATPEIATRAYSDGTTANKLQYAVYHMNDTQYGTISHKTTDAEIHGTTTLSLQLTAGETYKIILWADAYGEDQNSPYDVNFEDKTMIVDYTNVVSNNESLDAFYAVHKFTVTGAQTETVELRRPFAQLNIGTNDYAEAQAASGYVPTQSSVTVSGIYNTLNLANGTVSGAADVTFGSADIDKTETFPVAGYDYVAMNYVLVEEKCLVDVAFTLTDGTTDKTRTVSSVPVQRNYRTNIYGSILTSDVDVNVEINPGYIVTEDTELEEALRALVDGKENIIYLAAGDYTMPTGTNVNLQGKTLTIKGTNETVIDVSNIDERDQFVTGATLKFEGVTLNFGTALYMGFANTNELTYKDCIINGVQHLFGPKVNFDGCTLNVAGDNYMVRTWGGKNVNFSDCTFNCDGKALLVYNQSCNLTVTNCVFNDNGDGTIRGKAAIEVCNGDGGPNCVTHDIIINNTTVNGFDINAEGINTNSTLWANKNSLDDAHLDVTIDGTVVY